MTRCILAVLLTACLLLPGCRPAPVKAVQAAKPVDEYIVARVVDGDTVDLKNGKKVRYIGIDTPEVRKRIGGEWQYMPEPYAVEAKKFNDEMIRGKNVRLEFDAEKEDKYGRWLAYVYSGDKMVNAELLRRGYASLLTIPPNVKHIDLLVKAQKEAQENRRGIWKDYKVIAPEEAEESIGKFLSVRGTVLATHISGKSVFLNFKNGFKALIFGSSMPLFVEEGIDPLDYYNGKTVEVTGKIKFYDGPRILIDHPSQIEVIE
jgi:micrococcal nuclease